MTETKYRGPMLTRMQALSNTQRSSGAHLRHPAPKHGSAVPLYTAPRRRSVGRHSQTPFPGEDAPGTGTAADSGSLLTTENASPWAVQALCCTVIET